MVSQITEVHDGIPEDAQECCGEDDKTEEKEDDEEGNEGISIWVIKTSKHKEEEEKGARNPETQENSMDSDGSRWLLQQISYQLPNLKQVWPEHFFIFS